MFLTFAGDHVEHPCWGKLLAYFSVTKRPSLFRLCVGDAEKNKFCPSGQKVTFDECVANKQMDCDPKKMWLQVITAGINYESEWRHDIQHNDTQHNDVQLNGRISLC